MNAISATDRLAIQDVLGRYLFAVDTADVKAVVAQFTPDAKVRYDTGQTYAGTEGLRAFAVKAAGDRAARQRMHLNQTLFAEPADGDIVLHSYLAVPQAGGSDDGISIIALRYVVDRFARTAEGWRIAERAIHRWPLESRPSIPAPEATPETALETAAPQGKYPA